MQIFTILLIQIILIGIWVVLFVRSFSKNDGGKITYFQVIFASGVAIAHMFFYPDESDLVFFTLMNRVLIVWGAIVFIAMARSSLMEYQETEP